MSSSPTATAPRSPEGTATTPPAPLREPDAAPAAEPASASVAASPSAESSKVAPVVPPLVIPPREEVACDDLEMEEERSVDESSAGSLREFIAEDGDEDDPDATEARLAAETAAAEAALVGKSESELLLDDLPESFLPTRGSRRTRRAPERYDPFEGNRCSAVAKAFAEGAEDLSSNDSEEEDPSAAVAPSSEEDGDFEAMDDDDEDTESSSSSSSTASTESADRA